MFFMLELRRLSIFGALIALLLGGASTAREHTQVVRSPVTVKGFIGGESHDTYVIHAVAAQTMTVSISWKPEHDPDTGDNHAEFWVEPLDDFNGDRAVKFGQESKDGKSWSAAIPKTGDYYIDVMAHPTAHYTLKVRVK